ncbi:MAG: Zinc metalloprotease [Dehalococcoidia bacterium]|nr:Zinc metalloprotease [Dehalococcoidia bacterium]
MKPFTTLLKQQQGKINTSFRLGKIMGIPIYLHISWFIIFALVIWSLSFFVFPHEFPNWNRSLYWIVGIVTSILFFASVVAHELAHSWFSLRQGIPVRSITLFIFGGVARISRESPKPLEELVMAAAGPVSSLVLAGAFSLIWWLVGSYSEPIRAMTGWLIYINISLAAFNLIPGFPLDGGRVLRSILWKASDNYKWATLWASRIGRWVAYIFIFAGIYGFFVPFRIGLLEFGGIGSLWLAFIGWFLENAASSSYQQAMLREALKGLKVRDVITRDCVSVPQENTLKQVAQEHIIPAGRSCFLATDGIRLSGIITLKDIKAIPQTQWDTTLLKQAMTPIDQLQIARMEDDATEILDRLDQEDINQLPVIENGILVGIVTKENLIRFIRTRSELGI